MKKTFKVTVLLLISLLAISCGKKKEQTDDIIVEKVVEKPQNAPKRMSDEKLNGSVKWVGGATYTYEIHRFANDSLPIIESHGERYYDNQVKLLVKRSDGTVFFQKTFTKANFSPVLPNKTFIQNGALLGVNLNKVDGNELRFVVSVGSPDDTFEEFFYVQMILNNFGATRAEEYKAPVEIE